LIAIGDLLKAVPVEWLGSLFSHRDKVRIYYVSQSKSHCSTMIILVLFFKWKMEKVHLPSIKKLLKFKVTIHDHCKHKGETMTLGM
jgi:hypothetical protein